MPVLASRSAIAAQMRRLTGFDWKPTSMADAIARWQGIERDILLEANARHDAEHVRDPWFRLAHGSPRCQVATSRAASSWPSRLP
ncbi:MAG: hypothetical protein ABR861_12750 [Terriglobales bacterium]|jgi:hypothetical protein